MENLQSMPYEVLLNIIKEMPVKDIERLCSTNRRFSSMCTGNQAYIYRHLLERDYGSWALNPVLVYKALANDDINSFIKIKDKTQQIHTIVDMLIDGKLGIVESLISEYGVDINMTNETGETILSRALFLTGDEEGALEDPFPVFKLLLDLGADVNLPDPRGVTPTYSALWAISEVLELILDRGGVPIVPESQNEFMGGKTFLMLAVQQVHDISVIKKIVKKSTVEDIRAKDKDNRTAYTHALLIPNQELADYLEDVIPAPFECFKFARFDHLYYYIDFFKRESPTPESMVRNALRLSKIILCDANPPPKMVSQALQDINGVLSKLQEFQMSVPRQVLDAFIGSHLSLQRQLLELQQKLTKEGSKQQTQE
jgi:ankyrin repeat protein